MTTTKANAEIKDPEKDLISDENKARLNAKLEKRQSTVKRPQAQRKHSASMGGVQRTMRLETTYAQNLYAKSFNRTCQGLYFLSLILYEHMDSEEQIDNAAKLNEVIKGWLQEAIDDVEERIEVLDATIVARPELADAKIRFSNPKDLTVDITTPRILMLQEYTERVDEWHQKANLLWNMDAMSDHDRLREIKKVNGNYKGLCNRIIKTHTRIQGEIKQITKGGTFPLEDL